MAHATSSQTFSRTISYPSSFYSHLPAYEDGTECSETSAYKLQTPGNYPKESIQSYLCFLGMASKFFFKLFFTIPVAPVITGTVIQFTYYTVIYLYQISCIFVYFLLRFAWQSSPLLLLHPSVCVYFFPFLALFIGLLTPEVGTDRLYRNGGRELYYTS